MSHYSVKDFLHEAQAIAKKHGFPINDTSVSLTTDKEEIFFFIRQWDKIKSKYITTDLRKNASAALDEFSDKLMAYTKEYSVVAATDIQIS